MDDVWQFLFGKGLNSLLKLCEESIRKHWEKRRKCWRPTNFGVIQFHEELNFCLWNGGSHCGWMQKNADYQNVLHFLRILSRASLNAQWTSCVCVKHLCPPKWQLFLKIWPLYLTLILANDLDLGTSRCVTIRCIFILNMSLLT